ncbi:hypothetical protein NL529_30895, partial [Klebsiella pneumoniae]|nr:hypothetical protein [Klebsiella pneumoniae]
DVQKVIDAYVADETAEIDAAVSAGKITSAEATTLKANLTTRATDLVNATGGIGGGRGGHDHGGPSNGGQPAASPSTSSSSN